MMRSTAILLVALLGCDQCNGEEETDETAENESAETEPAEEPIEPLPEVEVNMDKVFLGRRLYHDPILSGDGTVACATCHMLDHGGAEPRVTSTGIAAQVGPINSPTVLNAHFNFRQFWDGRAADLQEQAAGPISNPIEMGMSSTDEALRRVSADEWYASRFEEIYGGDDPISMDNLTDAIAEYERYLVTPSPFDEYLAGNEEAISEQARRGYATFKETGCTSCHRGVNVGGDMYQKMGVVEDYFEMRGGELTEADMGRFNVTNEESDRHFFKVPTLRNVAETSPYFHDGSQEELADAVRIMAQVQLGRQLEDDDVDDIVAFLESLSGELPEHAELPESDAIPDRRIEQIEEAEEAGTQGDTEVVGHPG